MQLHMCRVAETKALYKGEWCLLEAECNRSDVTGKGVEHIQPKAREVEIQRRYDAPALLQEGCRVSQKLVADLGIVRSCDVLI